MHAATGVVCQARCYDARPHAGGAHQLDASLVLAAVTGWQSSYTFAHWALKFTGWPAPEDHHLRALLRFERPQALQGLTHMALWLTVPLTAHPAAPVASTSAHPHAANGATAAAAGVSPSSSTSASKHEPEERTAAAAASASAPCSAAVPPAADAWESWHQVRSLCDQHNLLGCVLRLGPELPSAESLRRWLGEPVKAVLLDTSLFWSNKRGYPVLPKAHQELLCQFFAVEVQVGLLGGHGRCVGAVGGWVSGVGWGWLSGWGKAAGGGWGEDGWMAEGGGWVDGGVRGRAAGRVRAQGVGRHLCQCPPHGPRCRSAALPAHLHVPRLAPSPPHPHPAPPHRTPPHPDPPGPSSGHHHRRGVPRSAGASGGCARRGSARLLAGQGAKGAAGAARGGGRGRGGRSCRRLLADRPW